MKFRTLTCILLLLGGCAASEDTIHPNSMSYEEILAYNETRDRIWDQIYCVKETRVESHIRKRYCGTLAQLRNRNLSAEQMNNINFGTPSLFR